MSKLTAKDMATMKQIAGAIPQDEPPVTTPALTRQSVTMHGGQHSVGTHSGGTAHPNPGGRPGESGVSLAKRVLKNARA